MKELVRLFFKIALSEKGPQDLPASTVLLALTVVGYFVVNFVVGMLLPPVAPWKLHLVIEIVFTLAWYFVLLRSFKKPERFLQTATAIFGYQIVLTPIWIPAIFLARNFNEDDMLRYPAAIIGLAVAIWIIRAASYILKAALEVPIAAAVVLVIAQVITGQLLLLTLTPVTPVPT